MLYGECTLGIRPSPKMTAILSCCSRNSDKDTSKLASNPGYCMLNNGIQHLIWAHVMTLITWPGHMTILHVYILMWLEELVPQPEYKPWHPHPLHYTTTSWWLRGPAFQAGPRSYDWGPGGNRSSQLTSPSAGSWPQDSKTYKVLLKQSHPGRTLSFCRVHLQWAYCKSNIWELMQKTQHWAWSQRQKSDFV